MAHLCWSLVEADTGGGLVGDREAHGLRRTTALQVVEVGRTGEGGGRAREGAAAFALGRGQEAVLVVTVVIHHACTQHQRQAGGSECPPRQTPQADPGL